MNIIEKNSFYEIEVKKSKFICCLFITNDEKDIDSYMSKVKYMYPKATHYCYAYILNNKEKCSDDKEPNGTAGVPILNILKRKKLDNILCVVVRYFGGIKLGTGGLLRAYTKSVICALNEVKILPKIEYIKLEITFPYNKTNEIEYLIKDYEILDKKFEEDIIYILRIPKDRLNKDLNYLKKYCKTRIL